MSKTLLLADDSVTIQKVVGISFASEDIQLVTVDNGTAAVAKAKEIRPDIVLADVVMPGLNGYEVCRQIKSDPKLKHVPVLLLTGTFEAFDEARAREAGSDGHITKPFEAQALVELVNARLAATAQPAAEPAPAPGAAPAKSAVSASPLFGEEEEPFDFMSDEVTAPSGTRDAPAPAASALSFGGEDELDVRGEDELGSASLEVEAMTQVALTDADSGVAPLDDDENAETLPPVAGDEAEDDAPAVTSILLGDDSEPAHDAGATRVMLGDVPSRAAAPAAAHAGDPFADLIGGSERAPRRDLAPMDLGDPFADDADADPAEGELSAPPSQRAAALATAFEETDPFDAALAPEPEPEPELPVARPRAAVEAPRADALAAAQPSRDELRNLLEKVAWEAFGDVTDRIVRETVQRVEQIAWEVIPKMAETLIREEIRKLKEADEQ